MSPRTVTCASVRLMVDEYGAGGRVAMLLHGFTGSAESMAVLARDLAPGHRVVVPDLVGHGRSDAPTEVTAYSCAAQVSQLLALLDTVAAGPVDLVGYSMGGRLALALAAGHPERVRRLVLIGGTAGLEDPEERAARAGADAELADDLELDGIEAFVDRWEALPMFASQRRLPAPVRAGLRARRLSQRPHGLANSLRGFGTGTMPSLWPRLRGIEAPTLLVVGELDHKYREVATRLAAALPHASVAVVDGAGHAAHVEAPEEVADLIATHLEP